MKKKINYIYICLILITIIWTILVMRDSFLSLDNNIYNFVISFKNETLTTIFKMITSLASVKFIIVIFIISLLGLIKYKKGIFFSIIICLDTIVNLIVKKIIGRNRPVKINWLVVEKGYSFPSGHTMISITFYGLLIYFITKSNIKKSTKILLSIILGVLILLIGLSRIYLGVHYFSDVIGGLLWGGLVLFSYIKLIERKELV